MSLLGRGQREPDREQLQQEQRRTMLHQSNLGMNGRPENHQADFLKEIIETPVESIGDTMDNLKSKDFPLANFNDAEVHKNRWDAMFFKKIYEDMHPPPESHMRGDLRKFLMDDPKEGFGHLRSSERLTTEEFLLAFDARITRGRDGFQQKQNNTSISVSKALEESNNDDDKSGWFRR